MHILLLYRGGGSGGDATVPLVLWDEWLKAGHQVTSYAIAEDYCWRAEALGRNAVPAESWHGIPDEVVRSVDAVHLHLANEYPTWSKDVGPLHRIFGKSRLFTTVHGPRQLATVIKPLRKRLGAMSAARRVNRIVVPSQHKVREWHSTLPFVRNVVRIANPVYPPAARTRAEARSELGVADGVVVAGFVGLFRPEKGTMEVLQALAALQRPNLHLVIAGWGPEEERLKSFAADHRLNVTFTGYLPDPSVVYRASDLFLFPSKFDNFPIALMQGALCDLPMVASDIPVVQDEFGSVSAVRRVSPGDVEGLTLEIGRLVDELPLDRIGLADIVERTCGPAEVARRYVDLFDQGR